MNTLTRIRPQLLLSLNEYSNYCCVPSMMTSSQVQLGSLDDDYYDDVPLTSTSTTTTFP